jgi:glycylpeptide N-tetradecanoyltransferase
MPTEESKQVQPDAKPPAFADDAPTSKALDKQPAAESENEVASEPEEEGTETSKLVGPSSEAKKGKKKSKRKTIKDALTGQAKDGKSGTKQALGKLPPEEIRELLALNPALEEEIAAGSLSNEDLADKLKRLNLQDIMTGLASSGKNVKDMASYKFWQTQPVPRFDETGKKAEGPLKEPKVEDVPTEPQPMIDGFEWVTVDPTDDVELKEIHELLRNHYVEDNESTLRFNYSLGILRWYESAKPRHVMCSFSSTNAL